MDMGYACRRVEKQPILPPFIWGVVPSGQSGEVAERSKAAVLKTVDPQGSVGSNPTLSANDISGLSFCRVIGNPCRYRRRAAVFARHGPRGVTSTELRRDVPAARAIEIFERSAPKNDTRRCRDNDVYGRMPARALGTVA
jgi:hypothetical protein